MKRYLRTKDGKIFDQTKRFKKMVGGREGTLDLLDIWLDGGEIENQADTIEELVFNGDLVKVKERITNRESTIIYNNLDLDYYELLTLWTEQNGNYIKVWTKEEGVI